MVQTRSQAARASASAARQHKIHRRFLKEVRIPAAKKGILSPLIKVEDEEDEDIKPPRGLTLAEISRANSVIPASPSPEVLCFEESAAGQRKDSVVSLEMSDGEEMKSWWGDEEWDYIPF